MGTLDKDIEIDPDSNRRFFNRELSWLKFNDRVLEEAENPKNPLLERLRFLSISASNLDEFYMVRVAGLSSQVRNGITTPSQDGYTPERQLEKIRKRAMKLMIGQRKCWEDLRKLMSDEGLKVKTVEQLSKSEMADLTRIYEAQVKPLLTPITLDPAHPFPFIPNLGFGLLVSFSTQRQAEDRRALIPIPSNVPRFVQIYKSSNGRKATFVALEDVLAAFANDFFPKSTMKGQGLFRVTRDSDIEVDEKAEDLVLHFESLIKERRRGRVVRLRVNETMPATLKSYLFDSLQASDNEVYELDGLMGMSGLSQLIVKTRPDLLFGRFTARFPERIREHDGDCFAAIKQKDILVHHPYEEFDVVVQFLRQAALDPDVVAIKQTLYRTSDDSPIVAALIDAAERGKAVTALVELKARFDEATNLKWARDLERAGAHVVYGFIDYKTHAKISLVIRREGKKLQTYAHLGTGNYHAQNAKIYTDLALFTADPAYGRDVGKVFNFITSYNDPQNMEKIAVAPATLRPELEARIRTEIDNAKDGKPAAIWAKLNALVDVGIIDLLYEASGAGVQIDLVVRGICCLRPGVKGLSENIRVTSIVGRFLEHARIMCFGNGAKLPSAKAVVYFSSADWMPRNLNRRVETLVRVENSTVRRQIMNQIMVANLSDETNSWELQADGTYQRRDIEDVDEPFSAHAYFMNNPSLSGRGKALKYTAPGQPIRKGKKRGAMFNDNKPIEKTDPDDTRSAG
ncbi:RNA degradosome polyphosphate kinase [Robiginitomaculum antarcticum]|uniref:RNA degradosome polyphosphate kinase n=1 Tax=Robiginitomaculum antarcticum TaxID=437507 RepID=UPI00036BD3B1|nr:RNA degradosome polyphosphate kinase [Robiginitomaculum antarcticum]